MKKPLRPVGNGENENKSLRRILEAIEEEHLADEEIKEYMKKCGKEDKDDKGRVQ